MKRKATAHWSGSGKDGKGQLSTQSGVLDKAPYSYKTRFDDGIGTNPEELIAAAHAGCFSMKLSFLLSDAGFVPSSIDTNCEISLENGVITSSGLHVKASVSGLNREMFDSLVENAKSNCPVSKLLNAEVSVSGELN